MYSYYVTFAFTKKNGIRTIGTTKVNSSKLIETISDIQYVQKGMEKTQLNIQSDCISDVVILSIFQLSE